MNQLRGRRRIGVVAGLILASPLFVANASNSPAQMGQYAHTSWTSRDGYSMGGIYAMAQTPDGYLWMATERGLARFDGEKFVLWQPPAGKHLPNNPYSLLVSRDGTLWMGTFYGLASWNGTELVEYPELKREFVTSLLEDRDGTIWAGTLASKGGLCEIRHGRAQCHGRDGVFGTLVWSLAEDASGALWIGADTGLWRWRPGPPQRFALPGRVGDLIDSADGLLVGIRGGGLLHFVGDQLRPYPIHSADDPARLMPDSVLKSNKLLRDRDGGIWIGTDGLGVHHIKDGKAESFSVATGLTGDIACGFFEDREGNVWFGSDRGLDRFRKLSVTTLWVNRGPSSELAKSVLATTDGSVWVAAAEGVTRWQNGRYRFYKEDAGLPASGGQALFEDFRGRVWVSTYGGLAYFDHDRFSKVDGQPGNDVVSIAGDDAGNLWLSGAGNFVRFKDDRPVAHLLWTSIGPGNRGFTVADRGGVWVGLTVDGGVRFLKDDKVRESYTHADGLGAGHVGHLRLDPEGALWAATQGGLSRIKDGGIRTLTMENGLPCNGIHWSIEDDRRTLWMYTTCGLVRVTHEDLEAWIANRIHAVDTKRWSAADGVPVRTVPLYYVPSVTKATDGKLWFVSGEGIQVVDPDHVTLNTIAPPVFVEQVVADRKAYKVVSGMRLPALSRDITIEFLALSLADSQAVQFRYRLEGHDTEWQDAGARRQAFYTNLGPGEFRFFVKASNNNGVWNQQGAELLFFVAPAYYQTNWFRLACVLLAAGLVWAGFLLHASRVRREETRLRNVIEGIPTLAFSVYPDGSLDLVNQRWLDYFGTRPGAQNLSDWRSVLHPADAETHLQKWRAALAAGEPFESETRHRSVAGEYRWFLVRAVPLRDANRKIVKWSGTLTDIEERKRAEDERERLRRLEAQLAHTNRLSMLGELTATIAHEINQPIGATIASAAAGLRWLDRDVPALQEARDALARIKDDGKRAADIIAALKGFYKKESLPERVAVDVNEVVREMLVLLHGEAHRHSVTMRTELASQLRPVLANRVQLQQVLMNLMVNGIEAMGDGGGELVIRTENAENQLRVSVIDMGIGIPADRMEQIFSAFTTTKVAGTGMGLTISRTIVESHDGRLWAEASASRGATFSFTLPFAAERQSHE
jgi:PAS domain S-box-containing protein